MFKWVAFNHSSFDLTQYILNQKGNLLLMHQVPGSTHYSMVFYFVTTKLIPGSLLQRFVDGDDEFRNSRLKLIPSVPKVTAQASQLKIFWNAYWI